MRLVAESVVNLGIVSFVFVVTFIVGFIVYNTG